MAFKYDKKKSKMSICMIFRCI